MRYLSIILFCVLLLHSCNNDDNADTLTLAIAACGVQNPIEELPWLKAEVTRRANNPTPEMKYCYIIQGTLNAKTVFIYEDCNPLVDKAFPIFNCEGIELAETDFIDGNIIENKVIIWRTRNFVCTTDF